MTFKPHDIVVVSFPFADSSVKKRRPALVISSEEFNENHDQLILAMITTAKHSSWQSDTELKDFLSFSSLNFIYRANLSF